MISLGEYKTVADYSFLYKDYSKDIKTIGAGDAQAADSKSELCTPGPSSSVQDFEFTKEGAPVYKGGPGSTLYDGAVEILAGEQGKASSVVGGGYDYKVKSEFGKRNVSVGSTNHKGLDIAPRDANGKALPPGTVPACTSASGTVVESGYKSDYGEYVVVEHHTAEGKTYYTRYAHLHPNTRIETGKFIPGGYQIGMIGSTGRSTGAHLHYEVIIGSLNPENRVDPRIFFNDGKEVH